MTLNNDSSRQRKMTKTDKDKQRQRRRPRTKSQHLRLESFSSLLQIYASSPVFIVAVVESLSPSSGTRMTWMLVLTLETAQYYKPGFPDTIMVLTRASKRKMTVIDFMVGIWYGAIVELCDRSEIIVRWGQPHCLSVTYLTAALTMQERSWQLVKEDFRERAIFQWSRRILIKLGTFWENFTHSGCSFESEGQSGKVFFSWYRFTEHLTFHIHSQDRAWYESLPSHWKTVTVVWPWMNFI